MSWDEDALLNTDARSVVIDMALHPPLPCGPYIESVIADAVGILQRARGREAPEPPDDLVILSMPADWANMCDWASDPSVVRLPLTDGTN